MKYQIFGDTHGETHWKNLLNPECIQIFLGDYFSPYRDQTYEECKNNFLEILKYKEEHPETILLLGNHDVENLFGEIYSRHHYKDCNDMWSIIASNKDKFTIAVAIGKYLITHAGVTSAWKNRRIPDVENTPESIASAINEVWNLGKYFYFDFEHNSDHWDCYGESVQHGPMWIRWDTLCQWNTFKGTKYKQIVGHTLGSDFKYCPNKSDWNLICIDCLAYKPKSLIIDIE